MSSELPLLIVAIVLFLGFLLLVGVIAVVASKLMRRRDEDGRGGCLPGCLTTLVLGCLGTLAFVLFAVVLFGVATSSLVTNGPIERVGLWIDEDPYGDWEREGESARLFERDPDRPVHLIIDVRGGDLPTERLRRIIERITEGEVDVTTFTLRDDEGRDITRFDFALPADDYEVDEIERELRHELDADFELPGGVYLEFKGLEQDF